MGSLDGNEEVEDTNNPFDCENPPVITSLKSLQSQLHDVFKSDYINTDLVETLMKAYKSNPEDWMQYANFDRDKLTRNLVDSGNGKFNLILVCWEGGHQSTIHDHANCHCFMRQLEGTLTEIRYAWPQKDSREEKPLEEISRFPLHTSEVSYINDDIGLHRMENASSTSRAVSLHLYCPPFDACKVFDGNTGKTISCPVTFWSKYGKKMDN
ncbi:Cysteine dioxygenase type 1 [Orchesella cincta]|uniref:Cysteine dioxygenase n=1 Tax=Orchesella cincta TaxID=48709 RepID=A0A1D2MNX8_ORCCI|nr:Cysteine dioxygenase type 1 [Orchesella cincta]